MRRGRLNSGLTTLPPKPEEQHGTANTDLTLTIPAKCGRREKKTRNTGTPSRVMPY